MSSYFSATRFCCSTIIWLIVRWTLAILVCNAHASVAAVSGLGVDNPPQCVNFTSGNGKNELYSPNYPNKYHNFTDCTRIIEAGPGQVIRLYFHEFHMEVSDLSCKYDWLEVRDGPFGYSPLMGRYCGGKSPLILISSTRYMWLAFHSDDTVESSGFKIAYQFLSSNGPEVPDPDLNQLPVCLMELHLDNITSMSIRSDDILPGFKTHPAIDCTWLIIVPPSRQLYMRMTNMKSPRKCAEASVEMYERNTLPGNRQREYCQNPATVSDNFKTGHSRVFLRLRATAISLQPSFEAQLTVFQGGNSGKCPRFMFHCGTNECVNAQLVCNGQQNCPSGSDEMQCDTTTTSTAQMSTTAGMSTVEFSIHVTTISLVSAIILLFAIVSLIVTCKHMARDRETKRQQLAARAELMAFKRSTGTLQLQETVRLIDSSSMQLSDGTLSPLGSNVNNATVGRSDSDSAMTASKRLWDVLSNGGPIRSVSSKGFSICQGQGHDDSSTMLLQPQDAAPTAPPPNYKDAVSFNSSPNLSRDAELCTEVVIETVATVAGMSDKVLGQGQTCSTESDCKGSNHRSTRSKQHLVSASDCNHIQNSVFQNGDDGQLESRSKSPSQQKGTSVLSPDDSLHKLNGPIITVECHEVALAASAPPPSQHQSQSPPPSPHQPSTAAAAQRRLQQEKGESKIGLRCANHTVVGPSFAQSPGNAVDANSLKKRNGTPGIVNGTVTNGNGSTARDAAPTMQSSSTTKRDTAEQLQQADSDEMEVGDTNDNVWKQLNGHGPNNHLKGNSELVEELPLNQPEVTVCSHNNDNHNNHQSSKHSLSFVPRVNCSQQSTRPASLDVVDV